jgi:hypothetical protein
VEIFIGVRRWSEDLVEESRVLCSEVKSQQLQK